eukprot:1158054-Pelagomonas_calceolata.AAC.3
MITAEDIVQVFEKYAVPKPLLVRKQQLQDRLTGSLSSSATFILHSDFSLLRQADRAGGTAILLSSLQLDANYNIPV